LPLDFHRRGDGRGQRTHHLRLPQQERPPDRALPRGDNELLRRLSHGAVLDKPHPTLQRQAGEPAPLRFQHLRPPVPGQDPGALPLVPRERDPRRRPQNGLIHFDVGVVDKQFTFSMFEIPGQCIDGGEQSSQSSDSYLFQVRPQ
ncbi:unnamed protein product, partial [Linum tenue]